MLLRSTLDRAFESILKSARTAVDEPLAQIRAEQATVNDLAKLVDAERKEFEQCPIKAWLIKT